MTRPSASSSKTRSSAMPADRTSLTDGRRTSVTPRGRSAAPTSASVGRPRGRPVHSPVQGRLEARDPETQGNFHGFGGNPNREESPDPLLLGAGGHEQSPERGQNRTPTSRQASVARHHRVSETATEARPRPSPPIAARTRDKGKDKARNQPTPNRERPPPAPKPFLAPTPPEDQPTSSSSSLTPAVSPQPQRRRVTNGKSHRKIVPPSVTPPRSSPFAPVVEPAPNAEAGPSRLPITIIDYPRELEPEDEPMEEQGRVDKSRHTIPTTRIIPPTSPHQADEVSERRGKRNDATADLAVSAGEHDGHSQRMFPMELSQQSVPRRDIQEPDWLAAIQSMEEQASGGPVAEEGGEDHVDAEPGPSQPKPSEPPKSPPSVERVTRPMEQDSPMRDPDIVRETPPSSPAPPSSQPVVIDLTVEAAVPPQPREGSEVDLEGGAGDVVISGEGVERIQPASRKAADEVQQETVAASSTTAVPSEHQTPDVTAAVAVSSPKRKAQARAPASEVKGKAHKSSTKKSHKKPPTVPTENAAAGPSRTRVKPPKENTAPAMGLFDNYTAIQTSLAAMQTKQAEKIERDEPPTNPSPVIAQPADQSPTPPVWSPTEAYNVPLSDSVKVEEAVDWARESVRSGAMTWKEALGIQMDDDHAEIGDQPYRPPDDEPRAASSSQRKRESKKKAQGTPAHRTWEGEMLRQEEQGRRDLPEEADDGRLGPSQAVAGYQVDLARLGAVPPAPESVVEDIFQTIMTGAGPEEPPLPAPVHSGSGNGSTVDAPDSIRGSSPPRPMDIDRPPYSRSLSAFDPSRHLRIGPSTAQQEQFIDPKLLLAPPNLNHSGFITPPGMPVAFSAAPIPPVPGVPVPNGLSTQYRALQQLIHASMAPPAAAGVAPSALPTPVKISHRKGAHKAKSRPRPVEVKPRPPRIPKTQPAPVTRVLPVRDRRSGVGVAGGVGGGAKGREVEDLIMEAFERAYQQSKSPPPTLPVVLSSRSTNPIPPTAPAWHSAPAPSLQTNFDLSRHSSHKDGDKGKREEPKNFIKAPGWRVAQEEDNIVGGRLGGKLRVRGATTHYGEERIITVEPPQPSFGTTPTQSEDEYYHLLHKRAEKFEVRSRLRERERLEYERHKLRERVEMLESLHEGVWEVYVDRVMKSAEREIEIQAAAASAKAKEKADGKDADARNGAEAVDAPEEEHIDKVVIIEAGKRLLERIGPAGLRQNLMDEGNELIDKYTRILPIRRPYVNAKRARPNSASAAPSEDSGHIRVSSTVSRSRVSGADAEQSDDDESDDGLDIGTPDFDQDDPMDGPFRSSGHGKAGAVGERDVARRKKRPSTAALEGAGEGRGGHGQGHSDVRPVKRQKVVPPSHHGHGPPHPSANGLQGLFPPPFPTSSQPWSVSAGGPPSTATPRHLRPVIVPTHPILMEAVDKRLADMQQEQPQSGRTSKRVKESYAWGMPVSMQVRKLDDFHPYNYYTYKDPEEEGEDLNTVMDRRFPYEDDDDAPSSSSRRPRAPSSVPREPSPSYADWSRIAGPIPDQPRYTEQMCPCGKTMGVDEAGDGEDGPPCLPEKMMGMREEVKAVERDEGGIMDVD